MKSQNIQPKMTTDVPPDLAHRQSHTDSPPGLLIPEAKREQPHILACTEVWGGNRKVTRSIKMPGLSGWVSSVPVNEKEGGDLHFLSVCDVDLISRVALADVSGHGQEVSHATRILHQLMRENVNAWDQTDSMREVNKAFRKDGEGKYATAIFLSYHRLIGRLAFSNAGHLPPLWYQAANRIWRWLEEVPAPQSKKISGLPVGLIPGTVYVQTVVTLTPGDILILYTDGITEAENPSGQDLGRERLLDWARLAPTDSPEATGKAIMQRLQSFRGDARLDDATLLVLRRERESLPIVLGELTRSYATRQLRKIWK